MLVESNNPDYVANLIEYFKADQDVCDFIMMWGIEEWKHYYALRDYLDEGAHGDRAREAGVAPQARRVTSLKDRSVIRARARRGLCDVREASPKTGVSRRTTCRCRSSPARRSRSSSPPTSIAPRAAHAGAVLAKLETLLAKDETRHEMFYEQKHARLPRGEPDLMPMVSTRSRSSACRAPTCSMTTASARRDGAGGVPDARRQEGRFCPHLRKDDARRSARTNAMRVFTEGNYLSDGQTTRRGRRCARR